MDIKRARQILDVSRYSIDERTPAAGMPVTVMWQPHCPTCTCSSPDGGAR